MKRFSWCFLRSSLVLFLCVLAIPVITILAPGNAQAFGSLTENGTAAFMGIGINPTKILHVSGTGPGTVPLFSRASDSAGFIIERTSTNRWVLGVNESPTLGNGFVLSTIPTGTQSVPRLLVTQDGRVGINTLTPDSSSTLTSYSSAGNGVYGKTDTWNGVLGMATSTGTGVAAGSNSGYGVYATSSGPGKAVYGLHQATGIFGYLGDNSTGVYGMNSLNNGIAVQGVATGNGGVGILGSGSNGSTGVSGSSDVGHGVWGTTNTGSGVYAVGTGTGSRGLEATADYGTAVYGLSNVGKALYGSTITGYAGYFQGFTYVSGNLTVTGLMSKGGGTFKIDHPQDPENKYLQHSFVESPEMKNVYDGTVLLDSSGEAVVQLPAYFESLNRDFRYQLTCIGGAAVVYIAEEINGNQFKIAGGKPNMKISWQVTGIRKDAFANAHPVVVEQEKPAGEKGYYLHAAEWGQPAEKGIASLQNK